MKKKGTVGMRPGEIKILNLLFHSLVSKSNKELGEGTDLDASILSIYLKRLQKTSLIERDIDNRKYKILERGRKVLDLINRISSLECDVVNELAFGNKKETA